jgi:hypothetical protein
MGEPMSPYKNAEEKRQARNSRRRERKLVAEAMEIAGPESALPYLRKRQRRKFAKRIALLGYEIVKRSERR